MQIVGKSFNSNQIKNNTNFGAKGVRNPQKLLTDKTMQVISSAIAATGIAGIALQKEANDYAAVFDKEVRKTELRKISPDIMAEVMDVAPILIETIITDRNSSGHTRGLRDNTLRLLVDTYDTDPELTEKLLLEKDKDGAYKYSATQIDFLVNLNKEMPEAYNLALENLPFVKNFVDQYDDKGNPLYGQNDILSCYEASKLNPDFTQILIKQRDKDGKSRFSGEQVKYIVENYNEKDEYLSYLLKTKSIIGYDDSYLDSSQILTLLRMAKDEKTQAIVKKLINNKNSYFLCYDKLIKLLENPDITFADLSNEMFPFNNEAALNIYAMINGKIDSDKISEILSIKKTNTFPRYYISDLKRYPELFTETANEVIEKKFRRRLMDF